MALRAWLVALKLPQYEEVVLGAGFTDIAAFATFDESDVQTMEETLLAAGMVPGHATRIMVAVRACQDPELQHKKGS